MKTRFISAWLILALISLFFKSGPSTVSASTEQANLNITQPSSYKFDSISNASAIFKPIGNKTAVVGQLLHFAVSAIDPDGDPLTYSACNIPKGANFDLETHSFSWRPNSDQVGRHEVEFKVSDGTVTVEEEINITVTETPVNAAPVIISIGNKSVSVGQSLEFTISAVDSDNDSLTFSASNLPPGAKFNIVNNTFSWRPSSAGTYDGIRFQVSDGNLYDHEEITITVTSANFAPVLSPIGDKYVTIGQVLSFTVSATDPNNDLLTFSASNVPSGADFDPTTHVFSWVPSSAGIYSSVHFQVSDDSLVDSEYIKVTVDGPPLLQSIGSKSIPLGQSLKFTIAATDPNNDSLAYSAFNLPSGATFDASTRTFYWKPTVEQIGTHTNIHFEVSDGRFTDWEEINIVVTAGKAYLAALNNPPILKTIGDKSIDVNQLLEFEISATDLDDDYLTYSAINLPTGASFDRITKVFSWTPTPEQVADFNDIRFTVSDGIAVVSESIAIIVVKSDITPPEITSVNASDITMTNVVINWVTSEPASSQVEYWTSEHELSQPTQDFIEQHTVHLTNLIPNRDYRFIILSKDHAGNLATSPEYGFTTLPAFTISELAVNPVEADVGEEIHISVLVTNHADTALSHDLVLRIANAKEETRSVKLAGGEQQRVTFTTTRYAPGEFSVNVNGITGSIMVPSPPRKVLDWSKIGLIAGSILAFLATSVGAFLLYRRHRIVVGHRIGRYSV